MKGRKWDICLFTAYCVLMTLLLFGRVQYEPAQRVNNWNPVPFETITWFVQVFVGDYSWDLKRHAFINLVGNVIMFIPLGFFSARLWRCFRPLWRCALLGGGIIVCVELAQYLNRVGSCDFDDLLLNVIGICMGYGLFRLCQRKTNRKT